MVFGGAVCGINAPLQGNTPPEHEPDKNRQPNVIIFLVDDFGWMDSGCYGSTFYETPNIDRLAAMGMRFTDAYSACTVSSPTRAALMTGKYPARLHITDFISGHKYPWAKLSVPDWTMHLPLEEVTVAEVLREKGYDTWHVGKWHLGNDPVWYPQNQGFAVNVGGGRAGAPGGAKGNGYFTPYYLDNLPEGAQGEYLTDRLTDEAVRLIEENEGNPFYLNMAHYAVHTPLQAKPDSVVKYESKVREDHFQKNTVYAAMIGSMDESLGRIMSALDKKGVLGNTLIIFTSDNGALLRVSGSEPLREGKGSRYEGGVRVPMIVFWEGRIAPGSIENTPVITMDIPATIMDIAASPHLSRIDGNSLLPVFAGAHTPERPLFWHYPHYHTQGAVPYSAVRLGQWKLIEEFENGSLELYNLYEDIGESNNLAASHTAVRDRLHEMLSTWRFEVDAQMPYPNSEYDPARANIKK